MASEKNFIKKSLNYYRVKRFLEKKLEKAGVSQINIQKTPVATRIMLFIRRPGIVVGRKGSSIRELCTTLEQEYQIDNPQLDVIEVENPQLDATLVAEKIGKQIEFRGNAKQTLRFTLKEVMDAGAIGAEISASGKLAGKGGKAKRLTVRAGYLKKSGNYVKLLRQGRYTANLKAGSIGIRVKIAPPGIAFPDKIDLSEILAQSNEKELASETEPQKAIETQAESLPESIAQEKIEEAKKASASKKTKEKPEATQGSDEKAKKPRAKKKAASSEQDEPAKEAPASE